MLDAGHSTVIRKVSNCQVKILSEWNVALTRTWLSCHSVFATWSLTSDQYYPTLTVPSAPLISTMTHIPNLLLVGLRYDPFTSQALPKHWQTSTLRFTHSTRISITVTLKTVKHTRNQVHIDDKNKTAGELALQNHCYRWTSTGPYILTQEAPAARVVLKEKGVTHTSYSQHSG